MNIKKEINLSELYGILFKIAFSIGIFQTVNYLFGLSYPAAVFLPCAAAAHLLIYWSEKKGLRLQLWGFVLLLAAVYGFARYRSGRDMEAYYYILRVCAVCLACCAVICAANTRIWLKAPLFVAQLAGVLYFGVKGTELPKWTVCVLLLCFLIFMAEIVERFGRGGGKSNTEFLFPVFLAAVLLLYCLPAQQTPMKWSGIKRFAASVNDGIQAIILRAELFFSGSEGAYSMSFSGYNEDGELGGNIFSSDRPQISLLGQKTKSPLYLAGTIYNEYTGKEWKQTQGKPPFSEKEYEIQHRELQAAFQRNGYTQQELQSMINYRTLNITFDGIKTKSIFAAPVTSQVNLPEFISLDKNCVSSLTLPKARGVGFNYELKFVELNMGSEDVKQVLRYPEWKEPAEPNELFEARKNFVYEYYTALPENLPERVYRLAEELAEDEDTAYDRLKAAERYLNAFEYTVSPPRCPQDRDFTDFFLYDAQAGYCTYFATAMAVLGRCQGIPTRYVEGYHTSETSRYQNETVRLGGNNAHAWAEAYIDDVGWVVLDPTPGYCETVNQGWDLPKAPAVPAAAPVMEPLEEHTEPETQEQEEERTLRDRQLAKTLWPLLLYAVAAAAVFSFLVWVGIAVRNFFRKKKYERYTDLEKMEFHMKEILNFGKYYGLALEAGETMTAYEKRLEGRLDIDEGSFASMRGLFQSIRFGGRAVKQEDLEFAGNYASGLERQYLQTCGLLEKMLHNLK